jgi:hypothetical protein
VSLWAEWNQQQQQQQQQHTDRGLSVALGQLAITQLLVRVQATVYTPDAAAASWCCAAAHPTTPDGAPEQLLILQNWQMQPLHIECAGLLAVFVGIIRAVDNGQLGNR